jgi:hypothetical protein
MTSPSHIFDVNVVNKACADAKKSNRTGNPLSAVFRASETARTGNNGQKYFDLFITTGGVTSRGYVRSLGEKHVGQIPPLLQKDVDELNAKNSNPKYGLVKKRDRDPTLNFQKYKDKVETDDKGQLKGELPGPDRMSPIYQFLAYLDEWFYKEFKSRIDNKTVVLNDPREQAPEGAVVVASTKIVQLVQTRVSQTSKTNPGANLVNPICRIRLDEDKKTGTIRTKIFDKSRAVTQPNGKKGFEILKFEGIPVNSTNVHNIRSHTMVDGILNCNAVCASNMGMSIPLKFQLAVIQIPTINSVSVDDLYGPSATEKPAVNATKPETEKDKVDNSTETEKDKADNSTETEKDKVDNSAKSETIQEDDLQQVLGDLQ